MEFDYDLFVIGGGSGGVRAARLASAEAGAKVGLAEEYRMGGTCVIRGCVPKKLMVFASEYPGMMTEAQGYGWDASIGGFDWTRFKDRLDSELTRLEGIYRRNLENAGVEIFDSRAVLQDPHTVALSDGSTKTARHILVAVGGHPVKPDVPGSELGITSNEIFNLPELPKSILIIGGGYIASEFACILNGLGVKVTQFYRGAQILRGFDDEARGLVAEMMRERGVDLHLGTNIIEMKKVDDGIWCKCTNGTEMTVDQVMFATGRAPSTEGLGLETTAAKIGRHGEIEVDRYSQTAQPSVFAVGDVTNRMALTPVAIREGAAFVETVFHGRPTGFDHALIASAIFTQPEMGTVGLSEEDAREQEPIEVYATSFKPMRTAFVGQHERVLMKLVVSKASRKVLGCHIVAPNAGELIQMVGVAIKMGATKEEFDATCAVHPTISEELVTMKAPVRVTD